MARRGFCRHLGILLWKNALLKWRTGITTLFEIGLPVLIMAIIIAIRSAIPVDNYTYNSGIQEALTFNPVNVSTYFEYYPKYKAPAGTVKMAFTASDPTIDLTPIIGNFTELYPKLAGSVITVASPQYAQDYLSADDYGIGGVPYWSCVVIINTVGSASNGYTWDYTIRMNGTQTTGDAQLEALPDTTSSGVNDLHWVYDDTWTMYVTNGELFLQNFIESYALMVGLNSNTFPTRNINTIPMPTPPYRQDNFADTVGTFLGLLFTVVFLWPVTRIIKLIVEEKETRIKEGMKMMGLNTNTLWLSWLITYAIIFLITTILITIITGKNVFQYSDKALIFFFFFLAQLSFWSFCFLISTLFSNSRLGSTFGALIFLACFFPYYAVYSDTAPVASKTLACLSPPLCFGLGVNNIIEQESAEVGVNRQNADTLLNNFSYDHAMGMLLLDFVFLLLLGLYFDKIIKQEYGVPLPWYFPLLPSYWCPSLNKSQPLSESEVKADAFSSQGMVEPIHFDVDPEGRPTSPSGNQHVLGVRVNKLRKEFVTDRSLPPFVAVNDLSLDMYTGQILALLGHNGAGKTTVINMLSGMIQPTSGDALIFGQSIRTHMPQIRESLGVCPQHNILFDLLTVKEHLQLYAAIKGVPRSQVETAVLEMIKQVGLEEKVHVKTAALSGGQKRKLSVAIALLGDSQIVFLDEPTSGMDPYSRRATWDLLKKNKPNRVIILTTHFMDEADQLGDRIAIMAAGVMQCCGSSLFLKSRFGVGYSMTIVKDSHCDEEAVMECVKQHVPSCGLLSNIAGEITYKLPLQASPAFADLFDDLDAHMKQWGVQTYGISVTTLEEVFLRVGHLAHDAAIAEKMHGSQRQILARQSSQERIQAMAASTSSSARRLEGGTVVQVKGKNGALQGSQEQKEQAYPDGSIAVELSPSLGASSPAKVNPSPSSITITDPAAVDFTSINTLAYDYQHVTSRHIRALFIKRWQNARRNKKTWCWTVIIPFLVLIVFLGIIQVAQEINVVSIPINLSPYNEPNVIDYTSGSSTAGPLLLSEIAGGQYEVEPQNQNGVINSPQAMASYLYNSSATVAYSRYGAYMYNSTLNNNLFVDNLNLFFNTTAQWSLPVFYNIYNTAWLRWITNSTTPAITLRFYPFPETSNIATLFQSITAIVVGIAFAFIPANFIHYAVKETYVKSKHQQMISGVSAFSYWISNFCWDFINYLIPAALCLMSFAIYDISGLIGSNVGGTIVALFLYGLSVIPFSAFCSFFFKSPTSAQNIMLVFYLLIGVFLLIASLVLDIISSTQNINASLKYVYRLIPTFCFTESIANMIDRTSPTYFGTPQSLWTLDVVGYPFIFMAWECVAYSLLVFIIEYIQASPALFTFFTKRVSMPLVESMDEDADVKAERQRLKESKEVDPNEVISIRGLRKVYPGRLGTPPKVAVNDLYLGVREGEVLGFLGINGAGKTTTMKMLTNDEYPTAGDAYLSHMSILTHQQQIRHKIGYCPQFDALIGTLTAREHLFLFGRIKGVSETILPAYVESLINKLGLQEGIADRPCKTYSGGNKRKLCVGIALIGNPPIVFLDEPSTGMDPGSRRFMWDLISSTMKGRSVILTTHSMEECEALCNTIAIMVGGVLRCYGVPQHLKSLYGNGYQLEVSVTPGSQQEEFKRFVAYTWPTSKILEQHEQNIKYHIPKQQQVLSAASGPASPSVISIGNVFRVLEQNKARFGIVEYAVSETSLEQIFIRFAKTQKEETGQVAGIADS